MPVQLLGTAAVNGINAQAGMTATQAAVWIAAIIVAGLVLICALVLLFLYQGTRVVGRGVTGGVDAARDVSGAVVETTGKVLTSGIETTGSVAQSIAGAIARFAERPSASTFHAAICEARPTFEVVTCKMRSTVINRYEAPRGRLGGPKTLIETMPVRVSYGLDMAAFSEADIQVNDGGRHIVVRLPPLRVLALEKGPSEILHNGLGKVDPALMREQQEQLDRRAMLYASAPPTRDIAEEMSHATFSKMVSMLLLPLSADRQPHHIEVRLRPRDSYALALPAPLEVEEHQSTGEAAPPPPEGTGEGD